MNKIFIVSIIFLLSIGCYNSKLSDVETVEAYFNARNARDFKDITKYVNDSLIITEGDYIMGYDLDSYNEIFKWDSVLQQSYEVVDVVIEDELVKATIKINSIKHEFLKNPGMTCHFRISLTDHKISTIESLECPDADWGIWTQERDSLVSWISRNHPELDGFIHDMTMAGAIDYLKAIKLYEGDKKSR